MTFFRPGRFAAALSLILSLSQCTVSTVPEPAEFKLSAEALSKQYRATRKTGVVRLYAQEIKSTKDEWGRETHEASGGALLVKDSSTPIYAMAPRISITPDHSDVLGKGTVKKGDRLYIGQDEAAKIRIDGGAVVPEGAVAVRGILDEAAAAEAKKQAEARELAKAEAKAKAEADKVKAAEEAEVRAAELAQAKEAKAKAAAEARVKSDEEAKAKADAKALAKAEAKARDEETARLKAEAKAQAKADAEAKVLAEKARADKAKADGEARATAERAQMDAAAKREKAEAEAEMRDAQRAHSRMAGATVVKQKKSTTSSSSGAVKKKQAADAQPKAKIAAKLSAAPAEKPKAAPAPAVDRSRLLNLMREPTEK